MPKYNNILVTGGAGFIGSHLVDALITKGFKVRVLDNLDKQIHPSGKLPAYFNRKAQFIKGDVVKTEDWRKALNKIDCVFHFASAVGVGQSMYEIEKYVRVNCLGTALFLDMLANKSHGVRKIIVAASMSSYGEGSYICSKCGIVRPDLRPQSQLKKRDWQVYCPECGIWVTPVPTKEEAKQNSNSIYAITKKNQEDMILTTGKTYGIPSVALRFFNVYGPRQSLSNPYNGVAAIFLSRIKNNKPPVINEDGFQTRDFIHITDVVSACIAAMEKSSGDYEVFNVGSGKPVTILEVAGVISRLLKSSIKPDITGKARKLDVRHCYADLKKIKKLLGWSPKIKLLEGFAGLIEWGKYEKARDKVDYALGELEKRGLR
ncbi:hypothetical protein A3D05_04520 [Candidatus Gottesmanbacteria bacterium RIFCSPHIGHO2_02_FULL_40_24]|uniref:NAD-dependent epimerase/dehydratase domain-containing protein n=1 Tax=Candidatus Gottesmanbacteria bacterium RIFCSPHIGHO2_01_FULL_40_15 TaxID=1798376 RepID=A0A1F5Z213_9BACT|nr:MAG: hypothetical protein A2777_05550 [Candidatus Gottesmanbacteria bacterium RIFCSPHIGHO2_01_FULL_40_15]OGG16134.1 MAG: hypothetical protein A3D05_04520 [Candidatus Gottesmanbacteria bacterium RIFCSPHIGHO2_02_FULL_40_24]OGG20857.1 MAG: hypothetical protein A3B48_06610 [Candidatus Gottesmanbacteria bacterium RIFCSPLOWO2_01_FULL_40_10]OGG25804.1 MAG: hypothetical protein A3E42_05790 [Candidatus Gottesmanbacteria bacterium RIFCSPHIGHO2_12_FULL_40_13]